MRLFLLIVACWSSGIFADELHLTDGRTLSGNVTETAEEYAIKLGENSVVRFPKDEVRAVEKKLTVEERYENLLAITPPDNAAAWLKLARWCRENRLPQQAKDAFQHAVELDPDDAEARRGAGYVKQNGEWQTRDAAQRAQGKELYRGEWRDADAVAFLQDRDRRQRETADNRAALQRILNAAARLAPTDSADGLGQQLAALSGDNAWTMLENAANHTNAKARAAAYYAVAQKKDARKLALLIKRLRYENSPALLKILTAQLTAWTPPEAMHRQLLKMVLKAPPLRARRRAGEIFRATVNDRLIEALIANVDYGAAAATGGEITAEAQRDGWSSSENAKHSPATIYPAHELLKMLTGQNFPPTEKEQWQKWWREKPRGE
ncbi:hypothetical protein FACS1894139_11270 [Planctomycetales bacterium]|nr:hypothetical protein FACS1894107_09780 [Planctomycetales bacterium]GHS98365.1 hypothetical protein FACS1894108_06390 [Planctomycetales bacterium]GHT06128.1 hypothetical protein FACS1894139_11270 [Planctomycetales bacterium]